MRKLLLLLFSTIFISCQTSSSKNLWPIIEPLPLNNDIEKQIEAFINTQSKQIVELGEAIRVAFFNINEIVNSGNWTQNEPFDFLLDLCKKVIIPILVKFH